MDSRIGHCTIKKENILDETKYRSLRVEDWIKALDNGKYVGAILIDQSKAFNVIPHGLFLATLHAYGCDMKVLNLIYIYLNDRIEFFMPLHTRSVHH